MIKKQLSVLLQNIIKDTSSFESIEIHMLTNDSREVTKGALFLAFPGEQTDGRDYIQQVIEKGAVAICYEPIDSSRLPKTDIPLIPIKNLKQQQANIATVFYGHPSQELSVIGVTGTNGKTSVTHFIAQAFAKQNKAAVIGTLGYGFLEALKPVKNTTPDPIRLQKMIADSVSEDAEFLAMEVSSHGLSENRMEHVQFDTAVFTNLTRDHLDFHGSMEKYREAKFLLFMQPGLKNAVINIDDETGLYFSKQLPNDINLLTYSASGKDDADIAVNEFHVKKDGFKATVKTPWGSGELYSHLLGYFNLENSLAVIAVLGIYGLPLKTILEQVSKLEPVLGRMMVYKKSKKPTVAIDYAHTPDALANALKTLRSHCKGQLWCVFGCGGDRDPGKRAQMGAIAESLSDRVIVTNDNPRHEIPEHIAEDILSGFQNQVDVKVILDRAEAIDTAMSSAEQNDLILVAGKGHETTQTIGSKLIAFSDTDIVLRKYSDK